jgi:hypothetical protein
MLYRGSFIFRPITLVLLLATLATIIMPFIRKKKSGKEMNAA